MDRDEAGKMPEPTGGDVTITSALARLNQALDQLESAAIASRKRARENQSDSAQVQRMMADRSKLARDLDEATARSNRLAQVNSEVSRRLVDAMESVRNVMEKGQG